MLVDQVHLVEYKEDIELILVPDKWRDVVYIVLMHVNIYIYLMCVHVFSLLPHSPSVVLLGHISQQHIASPW